MNSLGKQRVLHVAMTEQVLFRDIKIHKYIVEHRTVAVAGIILDDDALQFRQTFLNGSVVVVMLVYQRINVYRCIGDLTFQQSAHITVDVFVLIIHVAPHFRSKLVIKLQNQERNLVAGRTVDGFNQFSTNGRQTVIHEISMRMPQILHKGFHRQRFHHFTDIYPSVGLDESNNSQKSFGIHTTCLANRSHSLVSKA